MPLMQNDVHIETIAENSAVGSDGNLSLTIRTQFRVRGQGPFSVELFKSSFTTQGMASAINGLATDVVNILEGYPG